MSKSVRIDLYLKITEFISSRVVSKNFINSGGVLINDRVAKPSLKVKDRDVITIYLSTSTILIEVSIREEGNTLYLGGKIIDEQLGGTPRC